MAKNVLVLKHFESPKEAGVYYRLVSLTGTNKGEAYVLIGNRIVIGRSEKADIRLNDTKTSREHAEITKVGADWVVTDLGSQNGIVVNDKKINQKQLTEGDKLIVGQTVFKFARVEVNSKTKVIKENLDEPKTNNKALMPFLILLVIVVGVFLMDDEQPTVQLPKEPTKKGFQDVTRDFDKQLKSRQAAEDKSLKEKLAVIYQRGLREYREGNYYRAIHEFNLALIISPGDSQAEYYLRKTKEDLDSSIEAYTAKAQRDTDSLKFQSAVVAYCSIIRLLYSVPDDPRHKNAVSQINDLEARLGLNKNDTDCLKKPSTGQ